MAWRVVSKTYASVKCIIYEHFDKKRNHCCRFSSPGGRWEVAGPFKLMLVSIISCGSVLVTIISKWSKTIFVIWVLPFA